MALYILQILITVSLVFSIVMQMQGRGLSGSVGGGEMYRSKRSFEKLLQRSTIVLAILFATVSIILLIHR